MEQIAPESREFLVSLFTDLRNDLANQETNAPGRPAVEAIAHKRWIYDALLNGLADGGELPNDETVREYVVGLAKATDEENRYEQAMLEHKAFEELSRALGGGHAIEPGVAAVDWDGLLAGLLHPGQWQIVHLLRKSLGGRGG